MKEMNITQEYYLCAINDKGILPSLNTYAECCLVASSLLELQLCECISIREKKVFIKGELLSECNYLSPLYEYIKSSKSQKINKIVEAYTFSDKKIKELVHSIKQSFKDKEIFDTIFVGILKNKERKVVTKKTKIRIIEKIRSELLEDGEITDEVAILTVLLDKAGFLKIYFSKFEQKEIKEKIKKLLETPNGVIVKQMIEYIDEFVAIIAILASV